MKKRNPYTGRCRARANAMKRNMYVASLDEVLSTQSTKRKKQHSNVVVDDAVDNVIVIDEDEILEETVTSEVIHDDDDDLTTSSTDNVSPIANNALQTDNNNDDKYKDARVDEDGDNDGSDDDIQYVGSKQVSPSTRNKRPKIVLSATERRTIINGDMLTDESINFAQNLLSQQFPSLQGLENTTFGPVGGFSQFRRGTHFIQILHTGRTHWVCYSNANNRQPDVDADYYDSLFRGIVTFQTKNQMAQFLHCSGPELKMNAVPVQQQTNGTNCGPFAIAYATNLAFQDQDPVSVNYDEGALRSHLLKCFDKNKMSPFPTLPGHIATKRCKGKSIRVELLCTCRMPWNGHSKDEGKRMAECEGCLDWFHQECEDIPEEVFAREQEWVCSKCSSVVH